MLHFILILNIFLQSPNAEGWPYYMKLWSKMSHFPKLPSPAIIKQLQNFPWADRSRRFILSVGYLFRVRESVWWPVNNFLLCCLHKKWSWSKRAEDVSICLTLISEECYEVAIVSTAHTFSQHWKYLLRRKLLNSPVSEAEAMGARSNIFSKATLLTHTFAKNAFLWLKMNNFQNMNRPPFYVAFLLARRDTSVCSVLIHC